MLKLIFLTVFLTTSAKAAVEDEILSPEFHKAPVQKIFGANGSALVISSIKVLNTSTFNRKDSSESVATYRLAIDGKLGTETGIGDVYREIVTFRKAPNAPSQIIYDTGAFQLECGAIDHRIVGVNVYEGLEKRRPLALTQRNSKVLCVAMQPEIAEETIWLDPEQKFTEILRFESRGETGGFNQAAWTVSRTNIVLSLKHAIAERKLPIGTKRLATFETITISSDKKTKNFARKTLTEFNGALKLI